MNTKKIIASTDIAGNRVEFEITGWHGVPAHVSDADAAVLAIWNTLPAQAAQVPEGFEFNLECADAALRKLTAIHPITPPEAACIKAVIVGARALLAAPAAEPAAQGEVVAWRRRHSSGEAAWLGWIYSEAKPKCVASATTKIEPLCRHLAAQPRAVPDPTILYTTEEVVEAQETLRKHNRTLMGEVIDQMVDVLLAAAPSPEPRT